MKRYVILHNIRSAHNVGSIFRTADGAGVSKIFLCGYTPTPIDRFGREDSKLKKTSLGAIESVSYAVFDTTKEAIEVLKKDGVSIISVEQTSDSVDYKAFEPTGDTAFIFGNEIEGVEEDIQSLSDTSIEIPMSGKKESLNVSVCAGIILFHYKD